MKMREAFAGVEKEQLLELAEGLQFENCAEMQKEELIEKVVAEICDPVYFREQIGCLTDAQIEVLKKGMDAPELLVDADAREVPALMERFFGLVQFEEPPFVVFDEVKELFAAHYDDALEASRKNRGWLIECLDFARAYYMMAPAEVLHQLYRRKVDATIEEMLQTFEEIPLNCAMTYFVTPEEFGTADWPQTDPMYTEHGIFVDVNCMEQEIDDELLRRQAETEFFLPSAELMQRLHAEGYDDGLAAYRELASMMSDRLGEDPDDATLWCAVIWDVLSSGCSLREVVEELAREGLIIDDDEVFEDFVSLLMEASVDTRMLELRGFTPNDKKDLPENVIPFPTRR